MSKCASRELNPPENQRFSQRIQLVCCLVLFEPGPSTREDCECASRELNPGLHRGRVVS